jgi:molybdopterin-containing oxidoreductase family membrane subunit
MQADPGVVGTFAAPSDAARAIRALRDAGVPDVRAAMPTPFPEIVEALGRPRSRLGLATFPGAIAGLLAGVALTVGTSLAWPLVTGGKPIVSIPPFVVVIFEVTVLVGSLTNLAAVVAGAWRGRRFPAVARTTGDRIAVLATGGGERAERILRERGAEEVRRVG